MKRSKEKIKSYSNRLIQFKADRTPTNISRNYDLISFNFQKWDTREHFNFNRVTAEPTYDPYDCIHHRTQDWGLTFYSGWPSLSLGFLWTFDELTLPEIYRLSMTAWIRNSILWLYIYSIIIIWAPRDIWAVFLKDLFTQCNIYWFTWPKYICKTK